MADEETRNVRAGSLKRLWKRLDQFVYPPVPDATRFVYGVRDVAVPDDVDVARKGPVPRDADVAREILEEAQELFTTALARAEAAERRATTLQGAVAIAASFTLAAGTLAADTDKVPSQSWRVAFAASVALVVLAFVVAGVVALQATSRIDRWRDANDEERLAVRARLNLSEAQLARADELLIAYGENEALARWKIRRTSLAAWWFRAALVLLVVLAGLFVTYALGG